LLLLLVVSGAAVVYVQPELVSKVVGVVMARLPLP
jgi:hypothetical protein